MKTEEKMNEKRQNRKRIRFIWKYAKPYKATIISGEVCLITSYLMDVIKPLVIAAVIDQSFYHGDRNFFFTGLLIYLILFIGDISAWFIYSFVWQRINNKFVFDIRMKMYERILYAKSIFLGNMKTGDVQTRINEDSGELIHIIQRNLLHTFNQIFSYVLSIIMVFMINKTIALFMFIVIPLTIVITNYLGDKARKISQESATRYGLYISRAFEFIKGIREVHLLNAEKYAKKYIISNLVKLLRLNVKTSRIEFGIEKGNESINLLATLGLFVLSTVLIFSGQLTIGYFLAITEYFHRLQGNLNWMANNYIQWQKRKVYVDRSIEIMEVPYEKDEERKIELNVIQGEVGFENMSFSYDEGQDVLKNITINIRSGERVALVGVSGAGKSTLAGLAAAFYEPKEGKILIDGQDTRYCSFKSIRKNIGIVQQDIDLFSGSLRFNLEAGKKDATDVEMWDALKKANIDTFVRSLENGLDTELGNTDIGLSGGQKQRVMLARIFLKDPKILIMDEATSALDSESELMIRNAFERLSEGRTTIIIAHRLSTIINCSRVFVLDKSEIVSEGTHAQLLSSSEHYRGLFEEQYIFKEI